MSKSKSGILALEDGSIFRGNAFGATKTVLGEAVFNTSMTGYQEILTDPSYAGQIVTMTYVHIGNYGVNSDDEESDGPKAMGLVIRELSPITSNWRSQKNLDQYLRDHNIPGLEGVDTRSITMTVRKTGVMKACLSTEDISDQEALKLAKEWPGLDNIDCAKAVSCKSIYQFNSDPQKNLPFTVQGTHLTPPPPPRK
jgi:carbamoyl-phosphate synthase small subunit